MKIISNIAFLSVLAMICLTQPATATISRINSLGFQGDYFEDDSNVRRWYGSLTDYPNQVVVESGNFNIPGGYWHEMGWKHSSFGLGAHMDLGKDGRYGTAAMFYHSQDEATSSAVYQLGLFENYSFQYGLDLGPVTAGVSYRHSGARFVEAPDVGGFPVDTFGLGVRVDLGESAYLDLSGDLLSISENWFGEPGPEGYETNDCYSYRGRAFIGLNPRLALVPLVAISREDQKNDRSPNKYHRRRLQRFGIGLNYFPDTDHLFLFNAEYNDGSMTYIGPYESFGDDWTSLCLSAGFESRVLSWLTTRGSVGFMDYSLKTSTETSTLMPFDGDLEDPVMSISVGASIHLGPGDLDFSFSDRYPETGFLTRDLVEHKHWLSITARLLF